MEGALRTALNDAAAGDRARSAMDTLAVVTNVFHDYGDPAALLAARLGIHPARTLVSTWGGNTPQSLLNHLCDEIAAGRSEVAVMVGGEALHTLQALRKLGHSPAWTAPVQGPSERFGTTRDGSHPLERAHGAHLPTVTFALIENAFRAARQQSLDAARAELGAFCARCTAVAADNPHAWFRKARSASTIAEVGPTNRMVAFPYTKYMNAIMTVNQGAAIVLASEAAADRLGLRRTGRVYPQVGVDVTERWYLLERADYATLPGVRAAGEVLFERAGTSVDSLDHLDLYSCFPIAPRLVASMLGLAPDTARPLTLAGGLPWFGGPGNNYATHAVAALVARIRAHPETQGMVHALGWNMSKHALAIYRGSPPPQGWAHLQGDAVQARVHQPPSPPLVTEPRGTATIEAYTVEHCRDGNATGGIVIGRLADRRRFIARLPDDPTVLEALERDEGVGRHGTVRSADGTNVFEPL